MGYSPERRKKMAADLRATAKFHGDFQYPEFCFPFAGLAEGMEVEMPAVMGHSYKLTVYTPKNKVENSPLHINIHGGGFVNGHAINDSLWSAWLADQIRGIVVDVDYTLSDEGVWPVCLEQCVDAADYAIAHCAEWGCDPKRISIGGYSAGGVLTMGVGMKAAAKGSNPFCLLVNGYGPGDMTVDPAYDRSVEYWHTSEGRMVGFTDLLFDGEVEKAADPYYSINYATDDQLRDLPTTLICAASLCPFHDQNLDLGRRLASLGVEVIVKSFQGAVHGFIPHFMDHWDEGADLIVRTIKNTSLH